MSQFEIVRIFNTPQEACAELNVEFNPKGLSTERWFPLNIINDPRGYGDARVRKFKNCCGGCVMNWKTHKAALWFDNFRPSVELTHSQRSNLVFVQKLAQNDHFVQRREEYLKAAKVAKQFWLAAEPVITHPYLEKKRVLPTPTLRTIAFDKAVTFLSQLRKRTTPEIFGSRGRFVKEELLVVPLKGEIAHIQSVQLIDVRGSKYFLKNARTRGAYWMTGLPTEFSHTIGITEGVATALTLAQKELIPVVAAMGCGNLMDVAITIKKRFPHLKLQVFGDVGNGEDEARAAAMAVGGTCSFPEFNEELIRKFERMTGSNRPTDFNDYFMLVEEICDD